MTDFRVLVTGSRDWRDWRAIFKALDDIYAQHPHLTVVHGACPTGADKYANDWAAGAAVWGSKNVSIDSHPADWTAFGKAAGFRRNAEMVASGADLCLAFIRNGSRGASHCAGLAEESGIPTRRYEA